MYKSEPRKRNIVFILKNKNSLKNHFLFYLKIKKIVKTKKERNDKFLFILKI